MDAATDEVLEIRGETPLPDGLLEAFLAYDRALLGNDVAGLDELFADSAFTLRAANGRILVGWDAIASFRGNRRATPTRVVTTVHSRRAGDAVLLQAETVDPEGHGRGVQTQLWGHTDAGWRVLAAHVTSPAETIPRLDTSVWRCVGAPLVAGAGSGPLAGRTVAVKDLFAVQGFPVGAGVPQYLAEADPSPRHAPAVAALLAAGADLAGIARTDQFAFGLTGQNPAYGTPTNPLRPGTVPGGSTSGPAVAVARGEADIALGTDTAGSVRVPASYQSLWGVRTTHDLVDRADLTALAPSFDTVGVLAADPGMLTAALAALVPATGRRSLTPRRVFTAPTLDRHAEPWLADRVERSAVRLARHLEVGVETLDIAPKRLETWFRAFRTIQAAEAWAIRGDWIEAHPGALAADVEGRFRNGAAISAAQLTDARDLMAAEGAVLREVMEDAVLVSPAASSAPPAISATAEEIERCRTATLHLTTPAGISGLPAVSVPVVDRRTVALGRAEPGNVSVLGRAGCDLALAATCAEVFGGVGAP